MHGSMSSYGGGCGINEPLSRTGKVGILFQRVSTSPSNSLEQDTYLIVWVVPCINDNIGVRLPPLRTWAKHPSPWTFKNRIPTLPCG